MAPFETEVRVRYEETDQMGLVYHANYLRYFEIGRTEALRARGMSYAQMEALGFYLVVVEVSCRYRAAAHYDDLLTVRTTLSELRKVRLRFDYEILRQDKLLVTGHTMLACLDTQHRPCKLPDNLRAAIR